jgi:hypothetical protein
MLKPVSAFCAHPPTHHFLEPVLHKTCASLACHNFVENNAWNLCKLILGKDKVAPGLK